MLKPLEESFLVSACVDDVFCFLRFCGFSDLELGALKQKTNDDFFVRISLFLDVDL